jgi:hypothetical protein
MAAVWIVGSVALYMLVVLFAVALARVAAASEARIQQEDRDADAARTRDRRRAPECRWAGVERRRFPGPGRALPY